MLWIVPESVGTAPGGSRGKILAGMESMPQPISRAVPTRPATDTWGHSAIPKEHRGKANQSYGHPDHGAEVGERVEADAVLQCIDFGREEHQGQDDDQEENRGDN